MTDQPPTPRYRYTLIVEGNTHDEIEHELLVCTRGGYLLDSDYYQRDEWHVVGGHTDSTSVSPGPYPTLPEMLRDWADTARNADTILKDIPMPQPRRDEAVEAGARAILHGATIDGFYAQSD